MTKFISLLFIIHYWVNKIMEKAMAGACNTHGEEENADTVLVGKSEKRPRARPLANGSGCQRNGISSSTSCGELGTEYTFPLFSFISFLLNNINEVHFSRNYI
jgi:hypothetical protein